MQICTFIHKHAYTGRVCTDLHDPKTRLHDDISGLRRHRAEVARLQDSNLGPFGGSRHNYVVLWGSQYDSSFRWPMGLLFSVLAVGRSRSASHSFRKGIKLSQEHPRTVRLHRDCPGCWPVLGLHPWRGVDPRSKESDRMWRQKDAE